MSAAPDDAPRHSLTDLFQIQRLFDFVPPSTAVELAATCWAGLVAVLRYGCGYEGVTDWWAHDGLDRWGHNATHRVGVRRILPGGALLRGLAARMEGVSRCVGRLEVAGAHFPAEDARAVSEAADAAGFLAPRPLSTCRVASDGPDEQVEALEGMVRAGVSQLRVVKISLSHLGAPGHLDIMAWRRQSDMLEIDRFLATLEAPAVRDHLETFALDTPLVFGGDVECILAALQQARALRTLRLLNSETRPNRGYGVTSGFCTALSRLIRGCQTLRDLELAPPNVSLHAGIEIARAVGEIVAVGNVRTVRYGCTNRLDEEEFEEGEESDVAEVLSGFYLGGVSALELEFCRLTGYGICRLAENLSSITNNNLVSLRLEKTELGDSGGDALGTILRASPALRRLSLVHVDLAVWFELEDAVATCLAPLPLEALEVTHEQSPDDHLDDCDVIGVVASLVARSESLRELRFTFSFDEDEEDAAIEEPFRAIESVRRLAKAVQESPCLRRLEIFYDHRDAAVLARAIAKNRSLRELKMKVEIDLVDIAMMDQVSQGLEHNATLRVLELSGAAFDTFSTALEIEASIGRLARVLEANDSLRVLILDGRLPAGAGAILANALAANKGLHTVRAGRANVAGLGDRDAKAFGRALQANRVLRELQLAGNIGEPGLWALRDGLAGRPGTFELTLLVAMVPEDDMVRLLRGTGAHVHIEKG
ncbi:unnamed protein product [Pedinophyceae sp. YPF-701]|nr:unnamed protein product [Pedinophyceae sp. YPF-701]